MFNKSVRQFQKLFNLPLPLIQAPMTTHVTPEMVIAVSGAGALGSLPCTLSAPEQVFTDVSTILDGTANPVNLNFLCHPQPVRDRFREERWMALLGPYYLELGLDPDKPVPTLHVPSFGEAQCSVVEQIRPEVVSFHFGLPATEYITRLKSAGVKIISSATTVTEAVWLERHGCDAVIAQGSEAGGHRGTFLPTGTATQQGTVALVREIACVVGIPIIAAGGMSHGGDITDAIGAGASAVQMGTAYLFCPEARLSPPYRTALRTQTSQTTVTPIFSGLAARVIENRLSKDLCRFAAEAVDFPFGMAAIAPLIAATVPAGSSDFLPMWAGKGASRGRELPAAALTCLLAREAGFVS